MFGLILFLFVLLIAFIVYKEYKNEKAYQKSRRDKHLNKTPRTTETKKEKPISAPTVPEANYPPFTHNRLIEMGLSQEDATEFVHELIAQIKAQIPLLEKALNSQDYSNMERLTHSLKGSATNIGTGGISDLLVAYNTYLKSGHDHHIIKAYFKHLLHYAKTLEEQYA